MLCREMGENPADVALAWLFHNPVVTAPIIGPRTMEQLEGAMRALEIELSADTLDRLDEIWPGPGGKRPRLMPGEAMMQCSQAIWECSRRMIYERYRPIVKQLDRKEVGNDQVGTTKVHRLSWRRAATYWRRD